MAELKCPTGMVLITPKGAVHPDEPAFCIMKTEVPQEDDNRFWWARLKKGFELLIKLVDGGTRTVTNPQEAPLRKEAARQMQDKNVFGVEIKPVGGRKPQNPGKFAGPRKPAVLRTWHEARAYCQGAYRGGDLPTDRQWDNACGDKKYCTASGDLNQRKAIDNVAGPNDVGSTPPNPRGVQDMTGNVWEWLRDDVDGGYKRLGGGSNALGDRNGRSVPDIWDTYVGFRCVAPPQDSKR
jgi:formylglycine-generating enzyme required for sulfatase activity